MPIKIIRAKPFLTSLSARLVIAKHKAEKNKKDGYIQPEDARAIELLQEVLNLAEAMTEYLE